MNGVGAVIRFDVGGLDDGRDEGGGGGLDDWSVFEEAMTFGDEIGCDTTASLGEGGSVESSATRPNRWRRAAFSSAISSGSWWYTAGGSDSMTERGASATAGGGAGGAEADSLLRLWC